MKKKIILFMVMLCFFSIALFADGPIKQLDEWGLKLLELFSSTWVKAICAISLIGLGIGMATVGRNEPGMMKKFIPWVIGVIVILSASGIVSYFFQGANLTEGLNSSIEAARKIIFLG